jgi:hypothetical protein
MNSNYLGVLKNLETIPNLQKIENEDGSLVFLGSQHQDTKNFPLGTVLLFLERDIFQATRRAELPELDVQFGIMKNGAHDEIRVQVKRLDGLHVNQGSELTPVLSIDSLQSSFGMKAKTDHFQKVVTTALAKLTEILWRYNRFKVSSDHKSFEFRFIYRVLLSDEICRIAQA